MGRPHVAYTALSGRVWHGVRGAAWTRDETARSLAVSVAVDGADRPHISYVAFVPGGAEVRYATLR
ncbi:MAG: hypothetical protein RLO52_14060 [Sandaracinaceae bacterium]|nr:MAG: hypothetical protein EVA89_22075 [Sandaracinaceae bacterium]